MAIGETIRDKRRALNLTADRTRATHRTVAAGSGSDRGRTSISPSVGVGVESRARTGRNGRETVRCRRAKKRGDISMLIGTARWRTRATSRALAGLARPRRGQNRRGPADCGRPLAESQRGYRVAAKGKSRRGRDLQHFRGDRCRVVDCRLRSVGDNPRRLDDAASLSRSIVTGSVFERAGARRAGEGMRSRRGSTSAGRRHGRTTTCESVRRAVGRRAAMVVTFARWELGLAVRIGNPFGISTIGDLMQPRLRVANREARFRREGRCSILGLRQAGIRHGS